MSGKLRGIRADLASKGFDAVLGVAKSRTMIIMDTYEQDTYGIVIGSHGALGMVELDNDEEDESHYLMATDLVALDVHHKLALLWLVVCRAGEGKLNKPVSKFGQLLAYEGLVFKNTPFTFWEG